MRALASRVPRIEAGVLVAWPRRASAVIAGCVVLVAIMGIAFHDKNHGTGFDNSVDDWIRAHGQPLWKSLIHITDPKTVVVLYVLLLLTAAWQRRWNVVALAVLTPLVTVELVEHVLKPLVHRTPYVAPGDMAVVKAIFGGHIPYAFPSGHESGIGSFLAVCGLLVVRAALPRRRKLEALAGVLALALIASLALVGRYYHYATDTIGSMLVCTALVLLIGLGVDRALSSLAARGRPRTARAA